MNKLSGNADVPGIADKPKRTAKRTKEEGQL
jgi:hypothetical protein